MGTIFLEKWYTRKDSRPGVQATLSPEGENKTGALYFAVCSTYFKVVHVQRYHCCCWIDK